METTTCLAMGAQSTKEKLVSVSEPKNPILARLQNSLFGEKSDRVVSGYSRMHNRHNRS